MKVVFRTDASRQIGTGHVMRCLTLADALRKCGARCQFVSRSHDGHLIERIEQEAFQTISLPCSHKDIQSFKSDQSILRHAGWLGTDWRTDAQQTINAIIDCSVDWIVIDHYALDVQWERELRPYTKRILVIDDLADRRHDCDLLLDQNLGREESHYSGLIPLGIKTLLGPKYALLRPEFAQLRERSLARRVRPELKHLLISMGGVDVANFTERVLDALREYEMPPDLHVIVVLGLNAPWLKEVRAKAESMPIPTRVLSGITNIAEWMAVSDLAVGSAGGTAWERCALGLPSLLLVQAENQKLGANALQTLGAAILVQDVKQIGAMVSSMIYSPAKLTSLLKMGNAAAHVTDGCGSSRVVSEVCGTNV